MISVTKGITHVTCSNLLRTGGMYSWLLRDLRLLLAIILFRSIAVTKHAMAYPLKRNPNMFKKVLKPGLSSVIS